MKITVIGGGPGGLYFSILLKKAIPACQIDVYERNKSDDAFGFGVVFSDETLSEFLTRDHVTPLSLGGSNSWENVVTACSTCNNRKASHLPQECGLHPMRQAGEPNYVQLVWAVRRVTDVQAKYIAMFYGDEVLRALKRHERTHTHQTVTLG